MPSFTEQVGEIDTRHLRAARGVEDKSGAAFVKAAGDAVVLGVTETQKAGLRKDIEEINQDTLGAINDFIPDEIEKTELAQYDKQIEKLAKAKLVSNKRAEYDARIKAVLRERSARFPALSPEFERITSKHIGDSATGIINTTFDEADVYAKAFDEVNKDYLNNAAGYPGGLLTTEGQDYYKRYKSNQRALKTLEDQNKIRELEGQQPLGAAMQTEAAFDGGNVSWDLASNLVNKARQQLGLPLASTEESQLSPELITKMANTTLPDGSTYLDVFKANVQRVRDQHDGAYRKVWSSKLLGEAGFNNNLSLNSKGLDMLLGSLENDALIAGFETRRKLGNLSAAENLLKEAPFFRAVAAVTEATGNDPLVTAMFAESSFTEMAKVAKSSLGEAQETFTVSPSPFFRVQESLVNVVIGDAEALPVGALNRSTPSQNKSTTNSIINVGRLASSEEATLENQEAASALFTSLQDAVSNPKATRASKEPIIESLTSPENFDDFMVWIDNYPEDRVGWLNVFQQEAANYTSALNNRVGERINRIVQGTLSNPRLKGKPEGVAKSLGEAINYSVQGDRLVVSVDWEKADSIFLSQSANSYGRFASEFPTTRSTKFRDSAFGRAFQKDIKQLNALFLKPMSNSVRAIARIQGMEPHEVYEALLGINTEEEKKEDE